MGCNPRHSRVLTGQKKSLHHLELANKMGCQSSTTLVSIQNDGPFTTPTKMNREELQKQLEMIDKVPGYQNALDKNNV